MRSLRKFAYAAVLTLSVFAIQPTLLAAADAHGSFRLDHEVHWQNTVLAPGDYAFSVSSLSSPALLTVRPLSGSGSSTMLLVSDVDTQTPLMDSVSKLSLVSRNGKSFVSTMDLPGYDATLRFTVPSESAK
ncbi:MAG: hypothetical protein WBW53_19245 [Terriglobales bacterium]